MAAQGGRYADNTSSQGLLLKTNNPFSVAGKRLPVVMTVMAREVNKGSLSIHCGHTDFYAVRNAGRLYVGLRYMAEISLVMSR